jgi:hypothetical protein
VQQSKESTLEIPFTNNHLLSTCIAIVVLAGYAVETQRDSTRYGVRQIEQMCDDRPDMKDVLSRDHKIVRWCVTQFENGDHGRRIIWDYAEPALNTPAEHWPRVEGYTAAIRISKKHPSTGLDKWAMLVFEFHNIQMEDARLPIRQSLCQGEIGVNEFAAAYARSEFDAMQKTKNFLGQNGINSLVTPADEYSAAILGTPGDFELWLKKFDEGAEGDYDPRRTFAEYGRTLRQQYKINKAASEVVH